MTACSLQVGGRSCDSTKPCDLRHLPAAGPAVIWRQPIEKRGDAERLAALREAVAPFVLRRLKRDVAKELPPKTELVVPVELGADQRELYEAMELIARTGRGPDTQNASIGFPFGSRC